MIFKLKFQYFINYKMQNKAKRCMIIDIFLLIIYGCYYFLLTNGATLISLISTPSVRKSIFFTNKSGR